MHVCMHVQLDVHAYVPICESGSQAPLRDADVLVYSLDVAVDSEQACSRIAADGISLPMDGECKAGIIRVREGI